MKYVRMRELSGSGFTIVEAILACFVFSILVGTMFNAFISLKGAYTTARQLNEMYTVLSACPEVDRALEFNSLSNTTNCYPNNTFPAEDSGTATISYAPALTVTDTSALASSDPLYNVPDSKVIQIDVGFPRPHTTSPHMILRMLITRNGIGQQ